jgi:hypothetical protein
MAGRALPYLFSGFWYIRYSTPAVHLFQQGMSDASLVPEITLLDDDETFGDSREGLA